MYINVTIRGDIILVDFEEWKKIHEAIQGSSELYTIKSFKPWESEGGSQFITIQLKRKD